MAVKAGTAFVEVDGDWSAFNRKFAAQSGVLSRRASQIGSQLGGHLTRGASVAVKAGAAGVVGGAVFAVKKAADFEQQLSTLGSVADASADQMDRFRRQALKAGADTKFSALEAAKAQTELAKGGLSVKQIMDGGLDAALALAAAGEMDLADAAATSVNAMKLFGLRGKDAMKVADGFATAANVTTADVGDFALALAQSGSAAKTVGLTFGETTAALEALAEGGVKGSDAGTSLKTALVQLASPQSKDAVETAKRLGINVFDASGKIKPLVQVAGDLRKGLGGLNEQQRINAATTLVGQDGFRALLALYDAGPQKIQKFERQLDKQGSAAEVARRRQDNLKGSVEQLGGSLETLAINIGSRAIPNLRDLTDDITGFTNKVGPILDRKDLTFGDKLSRIFEVAKVESEPWRDKVADALHDADLPGLLSDTVTAATPAVADALAGQAPRVAKAFAGAFVDAGPWGRLLIGGVLLKKMGGLGAFRSLGTQAGGAFAAGVAATAGPAIAAATAGPVGPSGKTKNLVKGNPLGLAATTSTIAVGRSLTHGSPLTDTGVAAGRQIGKGVATGVATSGLRGRLTGMFRGWGPTIGAALGIAIAPEVGKRIVEAGRTATPEFNLPKKPEIGLDFLLPGAPFEDVRRKLFGVNSELEKFGQTAERAFSQFQKAGDSRGLSEMSRQARALARQFPEASRELGRFADAADAAAREAAGSFRDIARLGGRHLKTIKTATADTDFEIRNRLGPGTREAKAAMAKNFAAAASAIKKSMDAGVISTKTGTEQIEHYMVLALQNMGFSKEAALNLRKAQKSGSKQTPGPNGQLRPDAGTAAIGRQRGGLFQFGRPGQAGPDSLYGQIGGVDVAVAPGEVAAVFNRHQLPIVNERLADMGGLPGLFRKVRRPHQYATGGIVALGRELEREGYQVSENPAFPPFNPAAHAPGGYHPKGLAIDVNADGKPGGEQAWLDRLYRRLKNMPGVLELLWRVAGHFDHLHVAMGAGGGQLGRLGSLSPRIARMLVDGPDSPLKTVVQGALDTTRAAAQSVIDRIATGPLEGAESTGGASGSGADIMKAIARRRGWSFADWWTLDGKETGHGRNLTNPTSTARLRGQFLDMNWGKYGPGSDPRLNPSMRQQIQAMADYIADRYGDPTAALAFHNAHNYYGLGGIVRRLAEGGLFAPGGIVGGHAQPTTGSVRLGKPKRRDSRRNDKSRKRRWQPPRYTNKLREVTAAGLFRAYSDVIDGLGQDYDNLERLQGLTDEQSTRTVKVAQATDPELAAAGLNPDEIARLRTEPDREIELLNPPDIQHRVGELDQLVALKTTIADRLRTQQTLAAAALKQLADGIAERAKRAEAIRARARENIEKIRKLYDRVAELNKAERQAKGAKAKRALRRRQRPERKRLAGQIDRLRDENQRLVGDRSVNVKLDGDDYRGGLLGSTLASRQAWVSERDDLAPDALAVPQKITDTALDAQYLLKERREWLATPPPGIDVPAPPEPDAPAPADNSELVELLREQLTTANQRTAVSEAGFAVLRGAGDLFPPFAGVFHDGGVVPGPVGAERTAIVQAGETITPRGGDGTDVRVILEDRRMRVIVNDVERIVDQRVRTIARAAGRGLPGSGGRI